MGVSMTTQQSLLNTMISLMLISTVLAGCLDEAEQWLDEAEPLPGDHEEWYDCTTKEVWSEEKQRWCDAQSERNDEEWYDCMTEEVWSDEKQEWCDAQSERDMEICIWEDENGVIRYGCDGDNRSNDETNSNNTGGNNTGGNNIGDNNSNNSVRPDWDNMTEEERCLSQGNEWDTWLDANNTTVGACVVICFPEPPEPRPDDGNNTEDNNTNNSNANNSNSSNEPEMFVCDNGNEIPMDWVNDGMDDCGDNSDENTNNNSNDTNNTSNNDDGSESSSSDGSETHPCNEPNAQGCED